MEKFVRKKRTILTNCFSFKYQGVFIQHLLSAVDRALFEFHNNTGKYYYRYFTDNKTEDDRSQVTLKVT